MNTNTSAFIYAISDNVLALKALRRATAIRKEHPDLASDAWFALVEADPEHREIVRQMRAANADLTAQDGGPTNKPQWTEN
jgi:hypothetical protein